MPVSIKGTGGGSVTLTAGAAAADTTLTIPNVTGTVLQSGTAVTVAQGGTGAATLAANNVLLGNGTSALQVVAPGTSGNVLTSNGTTWTSAAAPSPAALSTASGSAPSYSARAWVNFDGTTVTPSTIRGSANVSSITKNGTGDYTMNFTTAMSDGNYATVVSGTASTGGGQVCLPSLYQYASSTSYATTSSIRLFNVSTGGGGGNADTPFFNAVVFR